jgi:phage replication O-like protein O
MSKPPDQKYAGKPEKVDGTTPIANELLEAMYRDPFINLRTRVFLYVLRWTYGFNRLEVQLSQRRMAEEIGAKRRHIQRALDELIESKRLSGTQNGARFKATYRINKYYLQWETIKTRKTSGTQYGATPGTQYGASAGTQNGASLFSVKTGCKDRIVKTEGGEPPSTPPPPPEKAPKRNPKKSAPKVFVPPTLEEVQAYFTTNGYSLEAAGRFFGCYANGDPPWHDTRGNPVRAWKQKAFAVWFKPENKPGGNGGRPQKEKSAWERSRDSGRDQARAYLEMKRRMEAINEQSGAACIVGIIEDQSGNPGSDRK